MEQDGRHVQKWPGVDQPVFRGDVEEMLQQMQSDMATAFGNGIAKLASKQEQSLAVVESQVQDAKGRLDGCCGRVSL